MPPRISRALIERLLHDDQLGLRLIQDLPILTDVWAAFGANPEAKVNLLLSPDEHTTPARAAFAITRALLGVRQGVEKREPAFISPLQGFVTATVSFSQLVRVLAPMLGVQVYPMDHLDAAGVLQALQPSETDGPALDRRPGPSLVDRTSALIALIGNSVAFPRAPSTFADAAVLLREFGRIRIATGEEEKLPSRRILRRATLNRALQRLAWDSVRTVKADAAQRVFDTQANDLVWAVIDSGIDALHPAFADASEPDGHRIWRAYDFSRLRRLTSYDVLLDVDSSAHQQLLDDIRQWRNDAPVYPEDDEHGLPPSGILIRQLRTDAAAERPPSWPLIEPLLRLPSGVEPPQPHGTHVAGILAGDWREEGLVGVCPGLRLLDIRVLGDSLEETEAAVIGALEFIRWLNGRNSWRVVHGVNLSIGMKHDVRTWACGQTPVCVAAEELVSSGVVVVAAAGNDGWQSFLVSDDKRYDGYASASIADPGNAETVITVGATHRSRPHLYGASFFSSRGPTGDGRMKPDLLAPGEKIEGPLPNGEQGVLDGTSMAAPHVSGVAALLMARHSELRGRPAEVKEILMRSAVDLGRERAAQGAGLVDALAALQRR